MFPSESKMLKLSNSFYNKYLSYFSKEKNEFLLTKEKNFSKQKKLYM